MPNFNAARVQRIRDWLQALVDDDKYAGCLALVNCGGAEVLREGVGFFDREEGTKMPMDAIFRIMSMTKPICAVAAMILVERAKFTLNTPVSDFIPEFKSLKVFVCKAEDGSIETEPLKTQITIRHLMTHTSGLPYGFNPAETIDGLFVAQREKTTKELGRPKTSREVVEDLLAIPLAFQPGTKWRYGMNIEVLGHIVELVSGLDLGSFCAKEIFEPLGMKDTAFYCPPEKQHRLVPLYGHDMDLSTLSKIPGAKLERKQPMIPLASAPPAFSSGGGGLCSTLDDYAKFCEMMVNGGQLNGVRILSPKTVELWSVNHTPPEALPFGFPNRSLQYGRGYSLATYVVTDPAFNGFAQNVGSYSWSGAWSTHMWIDPTAKLYGIFLTHHQPAMYYETDNEFQQLTYAAME